MWNILLFLYRQFTHITLVHVILSKTMPWKWQTITACPKNKKRLLNVVLILGQRRRRWANINPTFGQCLVFAGNYSNQKQETFTQCCVNIGSTSQTVGQHYPNIWSMSRVCWELLQSAAVVFFFTLGNTSTSLYCMRIFHRSFCRNGMTFSFLSMKHLVVC